MSCATVPHRPASTPCPLLQANLSNSITQRHAKPYLKLYQKQEARLKARRVALRGLSYARSQHAPLSPNRASPTYFTICTRHPWSAVPSPYATNKNRNCRAIRPPKQMSNWTTNCCLWPPGCARSLACLQKSGQMSQNLCPSPCDCCPKLALSDKTSHPG